MAPLTLGQLLESEVTAVTALTSVNRGRPVVDLHLIMDRRAPAASPPHVVFVLPFADVDGPTLDSLILALARLEAAALVVPLKRIATATQLLADHAKLPVLGVHLEELGPLVHGWTRLLMDQELMQWTQLEGWRDHVEALWKQYPSLATFLDVLASEGVQVTIQETEGPGSEADAEGRHDVIVTWGRGTGTRVSTRFPTQHFAARAAHYLMHLVEISLDREASEIESDLRLRGELLLELLVERGAPSGSVMRAAERHGLDLARENLVILWDLDAFSEYIRRAHNSEARVLRLKRELTKALEHHAGLQFGSRTWVLPHSDEFVMITSVKSADWPPDRVTQRIHAIQTHAQAILKDYQAPGITAGIGFAYSGPQGLKRSFEEAHEALLVGRSQAGLGSVTHFKDLGLSRFLYGWVNSPRSQSLAIDFIKPLLHDDTRQSQELLRTLKVYLDAQARPSLAAERLGIHRNSLRYRLERIGRLLNVDLDDADALLILQLVLRALPSLDDLHEE